MGEALNSTKAAALIQQSTGRSCSRQNLEKLCGPRGSLVDCVIQAKPLRIDASLVVDEYLQKVGLHQVEARQPTTSRPSQGSAAPQQRRNASPPPPPVDQIPDYTISRARTEWEKANILEMDRKAKANLLLPRADVEQAWDAAVNITRTRLLGVPSVMKQRIPHLAPDEVAIALDLIREALDELAAGDVMERYPEGDL